MRKRSMFSLIAVMLLAVAAFTFAATTSESVAAEQTDRESQIREASRAWDEAFNAEDVDALMKLYARGAASMPPGFPASESKEAIRSDLTFYFKKFDRKHETTIVDLLISGNVAVERGAYTLTEGDKIVETGKHIVVREKLGNEWLIVWEIWNIHE